MHEPIKYLECSCCGQYHREGFGGDCQDDSQRYSFDEIIEDYNGGTPTEIINIEAQIVKKD